MKKNKLGNTEIRISEMILGTWLMGDAEYWGASDQLESEKAIHTAWEGGITTFDTAYVYGNGLSEEVLGKAVKGFPREEMTIMSKIWRPDLPKDRVKPACERSLKYLGMDYLDVYFIHYPSITGDPIEETMESLMQLKEEGKIRSIGVSNFSLEQLKEARKYGDIDIIQPCYSLVWRFLDGPEFQYCKENHIGVVPYSPLAQGLLTGKYKSDKVFPKSDGRSSAPLFLHPYFDGALKVADFLKPYAEKYDRTQAQIAIRWLMQTPGITAPIVGGRNASQVAENLKAVNFELTAEDYKEIDDYSKKFTDTLPHFVNFFNATIVED